MLPLLCSSYHALRVARRCDLRSSILHLPSLLHHISAHWPLETPKLPFRPSLALGHLSFSQDISMSPLSGSSEHPFMAQPHPQALWLPWKRWESVAVNIYRIPREASTWTLWEAFSREGSICSIDIWDDRHGERGSNGRVRFKYVLKPFLALYNAFKNAALT